MVLINEKPFFNVVLVIEGSANLGLYFDQFKGSYIVPTLEYFFGGSIKDSSEIGYDTTLNSSLFAVVDFNTYDAEPSLTTNVRGPTTLPSKLLQWIDEISFLSGVSPLSNINEALANALQCFDDLDSIRENSGNQSAKNATKHCILICNSSAYPLPTSESVTYNGLLTDQLISVFNERNINISVFSPRKIPFLFKLFEKANGDLKTVFTKNYAKDTRHLILLKDFQLNEHSQQQIIQKPNLSINQQTNSSATQQQNGQQSNGNILNDIKPAPSPSSTGSVKRPLSPASASQGAPPQTIPALQNPGVNQPIRPNLMLSNQSTFNNNNIVNNKLDINVMKVTQNNARGASPVSRTNWTPTPNNQPQQNNSVPSPGNLNSNVPSNQQLNSSVASPQQPQQMPAITIVNQLNSNTMRSNTPNMQQPQMINQQQQQQQQVNMGGNMQMQQANTNVQMINQQQPQTIVVKNATPVNGQQQMGPGMRQMVVNQQQQQQQQIRPPINLNNNFNTQPPPQQPQQQNQMFIPNRSSPHPQSMQPGQQQINSQQTIMNQPPQQMNVQMNQGNLNSNMMDNNMQQQLQNKQPVMMPQQTGQQLPVQQTRMAGIKQSRTIWEGLIEFRTQQHQSYSINCKINSNVNPNTNETDFQATDLPPKMHLQFVLKNLVTKQAPLLRNNSIQVTFHPDKEKQPEEYQKLMSLLQSQSTAGIICLNNARLRLIIVFLMQDKQTMTGIIPNDQETCLNAIKEEQARYKMMNQQQQTQKRNAQTMNQQSNIMVAQQIPQQPMNQMGQQINQPNINQQQMNQQTMNPQHVNQPMSVHQQNPQQINAQQINPQQINPQQINPQQINPQQINPQQINPQQINPQQINPQQINPQQINPQQQQTFYQPNQNIQAGMQQAPNQIQQPQVQTNQPVNTFNNPNIRTVNMQQVPQQQINPQQINQQQSMNVHRQNPQQQNILLNKALNSNHNVINVQQQQQMKQMPGNQAPQQLPVRQQLHNHIINSGNVNNSNSANLRTLLQGQSQIRGPVQGQIRHFIQQNPTQQQQIPNQQQPQQWNNV